MKFIWNIFIHLHIKKQTHSCPNPEIQYCGIHAIHSTDLLQLLITKSSRLSPSSSWSLKWKMKHPLCYWVGVIHWSQHKSETWSMDYIQALKHWELSNLQSVLLLIQLSYGHINSPGLLGFSITPSIIDWPPLLTHSKLLIPQSFSPLYPSCLFFHPSGHMWQLPWLCSLDSSRGNRQSREATAFLLCGRFWCNCCWWQSEEASHKSPKFKGIEYTGSRKSTRLD